MSQIQIPAIRQFCLISTTIRTNPIHSIILSQYVFYNLFFGIWHHCQINPLQQQLLLRPKLYSPEPLPHNVVSKSYTSILRMYGAHGRTCRGSTMSHDDICSMGSKDVRMYHGMRLVALPWPLLHDLVQQQASLLGWRDVLLPFYLIFWLCGMDGTQDRMDTT